jgi:cytoskeletal protein CcmA (bactofilin family)
MFGSNPKTSSATSPSKATHQSNHGSAPNRISNGVSITGDVKFSGELVIDGEVEGNITSSGKLTVGTHATVIGDIRIGFVTVQGAVEGERPGKRTLRIASRCQSSRRHRIAAPGHGRKCQLRRQRHHNAEERLTKAQVIEQ